MVTDGNIEQPISPRQALIRVGSTALAGAAIGGVKLVTGLGLPCPFRAFTGWLCPLCGGTHVAAALVQGDVVSAWQANPLLLVVAVAIGIRAVGWVVEIIRNPHLPTRRWLPALWTRHWVGISAVVSVLYVLARNVSPSF